MTYLKGEVLWGVVASHGRFMYVYVIKLRDILSLVGDADIGH